MSIQSTLRQLKFHREFRIMQSPWPSEIATAVVKMGQVLSQPAKLNEAKSEVSAPPISTSLVADIGTGIWRLQQRMIDVKTGEPFEEMRRPLRHVQWIRDKLTDAGVEINDHTGERVPESGIYALKVVSYEEKPELLHDQVLETIKPTIFLHKNRIQIGEVIVGTSHRN